MAGDFFLGVDLLATSMLFNFMLVCLALLVLPVRNPTLAAEIRFLRKTPARTAVGVVGTLVLASFLAIHIAKDMTSEVAAWYFHSTPIWLLVMGAASLVFAWKWRQLRREGVALDTLFATLPEE